MSNKSNRSFSHFRTVRNLPLRLKLQVLFKNTESIIGFAFLLLGLPMLILFGSGSFSGTSWNNDDPIIEGNISYITETNTEINEEIVWEFHYEFQLANGNFYSGKGYSRNTTMNEGDPLEVQYKLLDPDVSHGIELNNNETPFWVLLLLALFPIIGGGMLYYTVKRGQRFIRIAEAGTLTHGRLVDKQVTGTEINDRRVIEFFFEFKVGDETYTTSAKTHLYERLTDEEEEPLIYNP